MKVCWSNIWGRKEEYLKNWQEWASNYEWVDGVPKGFLHVKLNPEITPYNNAYVLNGIRSFLTKEDLIFSKQEIAKSLKTLDTVF